MAPACLTRHEAFNSEIEELLREDPSNWDRLIANDLAAELKLTLGEGPNGIPEIRRFLAVKGYRALKVHLQEAVAEQVGEAALRAMIKGMRDFAHLRPGLSAATFRSAVTDCPEWREAGKSLSDWLCRLLVDQGLTNMKRRKPCVRSGPLYADLLFTKCKVRSLITRTSMSASCLASTPSYETYGIMRRGRPKVSPSFRRGKCIFSSG